MTVDGQWFFNILVAKFKKTKSLEIKRNKHLNVLKLTIQSK